MIAVLQEGCIPISYHKCIFFLYWTFWCILVYHKKVQSFQRYFISYYFVSGLSLFFLFSTETSKPKNIQKFKVFLSSNDLKNICILKAMCGLCDAGNWWIPNEKSLTFIPHKWRNKSISCSEILWHADLLKITR